MSTDIIRLDLSPTEAAGIRAVLDDVLADPTMLDQFRFVEYAGLLAQRLPAAIREQFYRFKSQERAAALHVTGNPVLRDGAPDSPTRYLEVEPGFLLNDAQVLLGLYGSLLGEAVGFTSQRRGSIFNTIIPIPELAATANSSSGSERDFGFHVEDAFHPTRAEFIGLACLRNEEQAATTVACVDGVALDPEERAVLFARQFRIGHNPIHETSGVLGDGLMAVLFGHPDAPYVTVNFATLSPEDHTGVERTALAKLKAHFERTRVALVLDAREYVFIDNYRCVHARDAFVPKVGNRARWLNRVVFTSDLRKSRALRSSATNRAIAA